MAWDFSTQIATRTLWQEARGEPLEGQRAVAHVLVNRLKHGLWGKTLAEVCLFPLAFSGWNAHDPNRLASARLPDVDPALLHLQSILQGVLQGSDPDLTNGAMWYFDHRMNPWPKWATGDATQGIPAATLTGIFGSQRFYKDVH